MMLKPPSIRKRRCWEPFVPGPAMTSENGAGRAGTRPRALRRARRDGDQAASSDG
jgi:hypothetical protein